jgi:hypothetical protein
VSDPGLLLSLWLGLCRRKNELILVDPCPKAIQIVTRVMQKAVGPPFPGIFFSFSILATSTVSVGARKTKQGRAATGTPPPFSVLRLFSLTFPLVFALPLRLTKCLAGLGMVGCRGLHWACIAENSPLPWPVGLQT